EDGDLDDYEKETSLMLVKHQKIDMKNFSTEVRARKDIDRFLEKPTVLLNVHKTKIEDIIDLMLDKIIEDKQLQKVNFSAARTAFFTKDSVHCLSHVIQGTEISEGGGWEETQNWLVAMADLPSIQQSHIAMSRLRHATNLGRTLQGTHLVVLILSPVKTKKTKNSLELGRTFATLLSDIDFRQSLLEAESKEEFVKVLAERKSDLSNNRNKPEINSKLVRSASKGFNPYHCVFNFQETSTMKPCRGIRDDFMRRMPHYLSDFKDGVVGHRTLFKLVSTVIFLYFACILPSVAFGVLNSKNTKGKMDVQKVLVSQVFGGLFFSLLGGQPLIILLTTAPLALYIKDLTAGSHYLTKTCNKHRRISLRKERRSITLPYSSCGICGVAGSGNVSTSQCSAFGENMCYCSREAGTLYLLLSLGTVLLGVTLYNFKKSPFLDANKREALADYALPVAVLFFSFIGTYFFSGESCDIVVVVLCSSTHIQELKKGSAFHLDLLVVAIINGILSAFGLPWIHGALPHSPLHVRALADVEERVDQGHVFDIIVKVRETRLTTLIAHILIGLSLLMLPTPLDYIPTAVLDGLASSHNAQVFALLENNCFLLQSAYPPNHYIRRVPQRKMHAYTGMQMLQLGILCGFGFSPMPYLKMVFPVLLLLLLPIR
ncbi:predicted protein, partial [Nematostella vectensis]